MKIAFYAPLKAPDADSPSGDRLIANMLMQALEGAGHEAQLACRFRSLDIEGDGERQMRLSRVGKNLAGKLARRMANGQRPDLWLTYHLYHKAPDWLGPNVASALSIPYAVAEASIAERNAQGPWAKGHLAVASTLAQADLVLSLNPRDEEDVRPLLKSSARHAPLRPFIDGTPFRRARENRARHRAQLAEQTGLPVQSLWLIAVGMMRGDASKPESYRVLAQALQNLSGDWRLLIVGDGPRRADVERMFTDRVRFLGRLEQEPLAAALAASDIFVWPAIKEAIGMVFLEAQAAGLPVIGARREGIAGVVAEGLTGFLPKEGDAQAFALAVQHLLRDTSLRQAMGAAAGRHAQANHDIATEGVKFARALEALVA